MIPLMLSVFCAVAIVSLGDLRLAGAPAIGVLVVWGVGMSMLGTAGLEDSLSRRMRRFGSSDWIPCARHVFIAALVVRMIVVLSPVSLSDDVFRYLWEGHLAGAGENPYLFAPADPRWLSDAVLARVNHPDVSAAYPPLATWAFAVLAWISYSPWSIKIAMGVTDAGLAWALARTLEGRSRSRSAAWLYALHPLGVVESAGSGHFDSLPLLCVVLGVGAWDRHRSGVGWVGLGGALKFLPLALVPLLWRRSPWLLLGIAGLCAMATYPFIEAGPALWAGLETWSRHWAFNGSLHPLLEVILGDSARIVVLVLGAAVVLGVWWRVTDPAVGALWIGGAFVLLSPTVHPWYVLWVWVPALLCGVRAWTVLATLVPISYVALASYDPTLSHWEEPWWPAWIQYLPL
ncbi:MAG: glycosyltransferase family 87 protein, partial [Myxococcota bacterium]|nr:glycosyltransferase family 87 protein [Myxococcota bacterium]